MQNAVTVAKCETLDDWLEQLVAHGSANSVKTYKLICDEVRRNPAWLMQLIGNERFNELMVERVREISARLTEGRDETIGQSSKDLAISVRSRPALFPVRTYVQRRPAPARISAEVILQSKMHMAVLALTSIDGDSLLDWTLGRCRSQIKVKRRRSAALADQARMLEAVVGYVGDQSLADDRYLREVVTQQALEEIAARVLAE